MIYLTFSRTIVKLLAILPWFAFLFGTIAGLVLLLSPSDKRGFSSAAVDASEGLRGDSDTDKQSTEMRESAESPVSPVGQTVPGV